MSIYSWMVGLISNLRISLAVMPFPPIIEEYNDFVFELLLLKLVIVCCRLYVGLLSDSPVTSTVFLLLLDFACASLSSLS